MQKMYDMEVGSSPITNEMDCPLLEESFRFMILPSHHILGSISVVHQCDTSCTVHNTTQSSIEREDVTLPVQHINHDFKNNTMYCVNVFCINYYT